MARSYRYLQYDVFTDHLFGGNQLAVFLDGRGLSTATMQAIAKEMNFSETTFMLPPENAGTDVRMRIFTPADELPMAGHPTIGSTFALARTGVIDHRRERIVFGLGIGPVPVSLTWNDGELGFAWMTQGAPEFGEPVTDGAAVAAALSVHPSAVAAATPVQVVSCGVPFLFVPLTTRLAVDSASVSREAFGALLQSMKPRPNGIFFFTPEPGADRATAYSRMFAPDLGIVEDPATGVASGPLGSYLLRHKIVDAETAAHMVSLQGVKMGRPSHVHIAIGVNGAGEIASVRVGGQAVLAGEGMLYV